MDDATLLDGIRNGDQQAMAAIFDRYSKMLYAVALRVLKNPEEAEDVMQDILVQLWRDPSGFVSGRGSLGAWLVVVARNRAIDAFRRRRPTDPVEEVVLPAKIDLANEAEHNILVERVRGILVSLPEEQQRSLELAYFQGLSHSEIAQQTGDPLGTVKTRIRLALISVRKALHA